MWFGLGTERFSRPRSSLPVVVSAMDGELLEGSLTKDESVVSKCCLGMRHRKDSPRGFLCFASERMWSQEFSPVEASQPVSRMTSLTAMDMPL